MRTSTCGTVMLVCATILGPITIVFLAVSFATDYWLEFKVDPGYTRLSTDNARVSHTRHRGIFRECYPGNDTACEYLFQRNLNLRLITLRTCNRYLAEAPPFKWPTQNQNHDASKGGIFQICLKYKLKKDSQCYSKPLLLIEYLILPVQTNSSGRRTVNCLCDNTCDISRHFHIKQVIHHNSACGF